MKSPFFLAASGLALSAFLIAAPALAQDNSMPTASGARVDANGMPTTHSTPEEHAQTADLNGQIAQSNGAADAQDSSNQAQYQAQQQAYQDKLNQHDAAQKNYQDQKANYDAQTTQYEALRARFHAERAAYHRYAWPASFAEWRLSNNGSLLNARVQLINGNNVGNVVAVARAHDGVIEGLQVEMDTGKVVWIDATDARLNHADGKIVTDLYASDIRAMADERIG
jgi:hypothetical protein